MSKSPLKIALVHDYLLDYGGAERVVEELHAMYPDAPVYVAFFDEAALGIHWPKFASWDLRQTWISKILFHKKLFSPLRILAPFAFASLDLSAYDVVISSSNAYFAKAVHVKKPAVHICYCHTPARSLYGYTTMTDWQKNHLTYFFGTIINHFCRIMDVKAAQRVDFFVANSREVQKRIQKFYRRDSTIIYPPVNVPEKLQSSKKIKAEKYFLYLGRLAKSKHVDLAVQACTALGLPLKVAGTGKGLEYLQSLAGPNVEFLGAVHDDQLPELYAGAQAVIFPAEDEDFGIVPIEAMGYGVPVIAHRSGGPTETIIEGKTGIFFDELNTESLQTALQSFQKTTFDSTKIYQYALKFSQAEFQQKITALVATAVSAPQS